MSKLPRYRPTVTELKATAYCGAHPQGEYVLAADHDAAIAALEAQLHRYFNAFENIAVAHTLEDAQDMAHAEVAFAIQSEL